MQVPFLVAGVRVVLRDDASSFGGGGGDGDSTPSTPTTPDDAVDGAAEEDAEGGEREKNTKKKATKGWKWSRWQLLKGFASFARVTITDVVVDASALGKGVHATSRVALTAAVGVGARGGLLARLATESVRASAGGGPAKDGEGEDAEGEDAEDRRVGEFVDARADATLRWRDDGVLVTTAALSVERIEGRLETDGGAQLCADVEGVRVSYRVETEAEATAETSRRRNASSSSTLPSHQPDESDPGPRACDRVVISAGMKRAQVATSDAIMGVGGSGAVAAATRCGAASVLAHAPKIRRDGGEFDDDAVGTIRAYASEVDACNHPALVAALAGALARFQPRKSTGKSTKLKSNSSRRRWDAKASFVDGVRARVHDDGHRVLCEATASEIVLSGDFGAARGGEAPSRAVVVAGARVAAAVAPAASESGDATSAPRGPEPHVLRHVCAIDRVGCSVGPVLSPTEFLYETIGARGAGETPGGLKHEPSTRGGADADADAHPDAALDLEIMGATVDVDVDELACVDASAAKAVAAVRASVDALRTAAGSSVLEKEKSSQRRQRKSRRRRPMKRAVTLIDVSVRAHATMRPFISPELESSTTDDIPFPPSSRCALDVTVPLSQIQLGDLGGGADAGWRLETSGWYMSYHDGVAAAADPRNRTVDAAATVLGIGSIGGEGRVELCAERSGRVVVVENGAFDVRKGGVVGAEVGTSTGTTTTTTTTTTTRAVSVDGVSIHWHPDAYFMVQRTVAGIVGVVRARREGKETSPKPKPPPSSSSSPPPPRNEARSIHWFPYDRVRVVNAVS